MFSHKMVGVLHLKKIHDINFYDFQKLTEFIKNHPLVKRTRVQEYKSTRVQEYKSTRVQEYNGQEYSTTDNNKRITGKQYI